MPNGNQRTCQGCEFWEGFEGGAYGECRRCCPRTPRKGNYPPGLNLWPQTLNRQWCAEFVRAEHSELGADR